jgi:hypothetical protein
MPSAKCDKSYVQIKDGCTMIRRVVYDSDKHSKYVKMNGKNVLLSELRGKFRYSDK